MQWTIPNILTAGRLLAAPCVMLVFLVLPRPAADWAALVLFVLAAVTDWFDGYLARLWHQESRFGTAMDPIADKAMVLIAILVVTGYSGMNGWLILPAAVILFREVLVSGLREFLGADAGKLKVTKLAKWKTTAQMVAIVTLMLAMARAGDVADAERLASGLGTTGILLFWLAGALTLLTGADYVHKAMPWLKDNPS